MGLSEPSVRGAGRNFGTNFLRRPTTPQLGRQRREETMADTGAAPAQYKQASRKGKKAWRKNVDVTQIQSGLEDVRDQIIQGYVPPLPQLLPNTNANDS